MFIHHLDCSCTVWTMHTPSGLFIRRFNCSYTPFQLFTRRLDCAYTVSTVHAPSQLLIRRLECSMPSRLFKHSLNCSNARHLGCSCTASIVHTPSRLYSYFQLFTHRFDCLLAPSRLSILRLNFCTRRLDYSHSVSTVHTPPRLVITYTAPTVLTYTVVATVSYAKSIVHTPR